MNSKKPDMSSKPLCHTFRMNPSTIRNATGFLSQKLYEDGASWLSKMSENVEPPTNTPVYLQLYFDDRDAVILQAHSLSEAMELARDTFPNYDLDCEPTEVPNGATHVVFLDT